MRSLGIAWDFEGRVDQSVRLEILAEDLTLPEYWYARRGQLFVMGGSVAAGGAGVFSGFQIRPQPGVAGLAVIEEVTFCNTTAGALTYKAGLGLAAAGAALVPSKADDRQLSPFTPGGVSIFATETVQAAVLPNSGNAAFLRLAADANGTIKGPWILTTNETFTAMCLTANTPCVATVRWRERAAFQDELR